MPDKKAVKTPIPGCIESIPAYSSYKGKCILETTQRFSGDLKLTFASCKLYKDICLDLVDIVSYNVYPKWYKNIPCDEFLAGCLGQSGM